MIATAPLHPTQISLAPDTRDGVCLLLNQQLANLTDLIGQTKEAHWNTKGPHFIMLHELYERINGDLEPFEDEVAERITTLGGFAAGSARKVAELTQIPEMPDVVEDERMAYLPELIERYAVAANATRQAVTAAGELGDANTEDLLTGLSRALDKALWFLEAHTR